MKIGLIGCGRVGITIGYFLRKKHLLYGIYDRNPNTLRNAKNILKIRKNPDYKNLIQNSDVLLFATPDDEILNAYKKAQTYLKKEKYLLHFSGLLPAELFPYKKGIHRGALHPFATFPKIITPPGRKRYILFFQGERRCLRIVRKIFSPENFIIYPINKKHKPLYHLLGVFSSNLLVALSSAIKFLMKKLNWKEEDFQRIIVPMFMETIHNVTEFGIREGLSGPLVRGDRKTIEKHLSVLKRYPELYDIYVSLSRILIRYAPMEKQKELKKILKVN
jgi:predicted short-subunit dehydrogenase-like oxidoreductase (DUF2520 family)